jgi:hypothetical protein
MRRASLSGRMLALLVAVVIVAAGVAVVVPSVASAQEDVSRPWSLRDLFRSRKSNRVERQEMLAPQETSAPKARKKRPRVARPPAEPETPVVEKASDARTVLVIGDFLGSGLAEGLSEVFAENPRIKVVDRSSGSSGFVRDDFYNWPEKITELIESEKPAAILVMLGANDRQQMRVEGTRVPPRSEKWIAEYRARADALAKAISDRKVPFLWVGVPAFKSPKLLLDMLAFNDIYRAAAEGAGAEFIDVWDGFVDENGAYVSTGPDINGQPVKLRANDGINLTRPGKRKVAFYTEKPLYKMLGETASPGVASFAPANLPRAVLPPVDVGSIKRTVPVSLQDPELDGGSELLGVVAAPKRDARSPGEKLSVEGIAPAAVPGRADDFSWKPPVAITVPESTSAIGR